TRLRSGDPTRNLGATVNRPHGTVVCTYRLSRVGNGGSRSVRAPPATCRGFFRLKAARLTTPRHLLLTGRADRSMSLQAVVDRPHPPPTVQKVRPRENPPPPRRVHAQR